MGFYRDQVYPRLVNGLGDPAPMRHRRRQLLREARGTVLEIGVELEDDAERRGSPDAEARSLRVLAWVAHDVSDRRVHRAPLGAAMKVV
jgi:hypothetical protein